MQISLEGQTAIITGAGGGIGKAAAVRLSDAGAKVFSWDLKFPEGYPDALHPMLVDITRPESVESALELIIAQTGRVDILINNAGITRDASLQKMSMHQWQQVLEVNLTGVLYAPRPSANT